MFYFFFKQKSKFHKTSKDQRKMSDQSSRLTTNSGSSLGEESSFSYPSMDGPPLFIGLHAKPVTERGDSLGRKKSGQLSSLHDQDTPILHRLQLYTSKVRAFLSFSQSSPLKNMKQAFPVPNKDCELYTPNQVQIVSGFIYFS